MLFQKWWIIRSILKYGNPVISILEKAGIKKNGNDPPNKPLVFIIGAPRTGSTILYQIITSLLDVSYIDNLANMARYNPFFGLRLSNRFFRHIPHQSFSSKYGNTSHEGLHAPAEPLFFYKWFPKDRHYTESSDLHPDQVNEFRRTLYAMINKSQKTLVIKNLSFSLRLQVLKDALPGAKYIVVRRDPLFTAQSLIQAKRKNNIPDSKVWGILPKDFSKLEKLDPHELAVRQIYLIEKQIHEDLRGLPEENILYIDYENLSQGLETMIKEVISLLGPGVQRRPNIQIPNITVKNRINLPEHEIESLKHHIRQLDWKQYNN